MRRAWLTAWALFLAGLICIAQQERVSAYWQSRDSNYNVAISGGGGGLTWNNITSGNNTTSCTFASSCTVASVTIPSGLTIMGVTVTLGGTVAPISTINLCSVNFTLVQAATFGIESELWQGITTGCTGTLTATAPGGTGLSNLYFGSGLLAGYTSATSTSQCNGSTSNTGGTGTVSCSSALTIPSSGIAIGTSLFQSNLAATFSNLTNDYPSGNMAFGHATAAGSLTPTAGNNVFTSASDVGATWH